MHRVRAVCSMHDVIATACRPDGLSAESRAVGARDGRVLLPTRDGEQDPASRMWRSGGVDSPWNSPYAGVMKLHAPPERVPIDTDADGVIRVGGTRVTLDSLVAAFDAGATAEEIAQQYDSVSLADVYSVIGYYLRHQSEVRAYVAERQKQAAQSRKEDERRFDPRGVRERLLARRR